MALEQATDIITLVDVKQYLNIELTDVTNDDLFLSWITQATSRIERFIDQPVVSREAVDILDGNGGWTILAKTGRIISLVSNGQPGSLLDASAINNVQYRTLALDPWQAIVTDAAQIYVDPIAPWKVQLLDWYLFFVGFGNIRLRYNAGFATVPGEISEVAVEMVADNWNQSKRSASPRLGLKTINRGGVGQSLGDSFDNMDDRWKRKLQRYRRLA